MLSALGAQNGFPSGETIAKIALYLDASIDSLLGMSVPDKEPGQAVLEACVAMTEEERKAFVEEMYAMDPDIASSSEEQRDDGSRLGKQGFKRLHSQLDTIRSETSDSISDLRVRQNALSEAIGALVPEPEPSKSLIVQFFDLPSEQQKLFVLEAIVRMESW
jgi:hypothetical protein